MPKSQEIEKQLKEKKNFRMRSEEFVMRRPIRKRTPVSQGNDGGIQNV